MSAFYQEQTQELNINKQAKTMKTLLLLGALLLSHSLVYAQADSVHTSWKIEGYLETYYTFVANQSTHSRPNFVYSHNRSNEVGINLGFLKASYQNSELRANISMGTGTYMNANYSAEQGVLKNLYEANIGVKVARKIPLWVDMGVMPSHIGFESAVSKDCWTLTRSLLADNSPYFETGAKVSYNSPNEKWFVALLLLNGWQRIQLLDGNNTPAWGHQVSYKPNAKWMFNSSSYLGSDKADSVKQMRYFHNFYASYQATKRLGFILGMDYGLEQQQGSKHYAHWYTPILICQVRPHTNGTIAGRIEYYHDNTGVIIATGTPNGFQTWAYSINYDYRLNEKVLWRVEARTFQSKDAIFVHDQTLQRYETFFTTSLAISL